MVRTFQTKQVNYETIKQMFTQIQRNLVIPLAFKNLIDIDTESFHEIVKRLAEEYKFTYQLRRKQCN